MAAKPKRPARYDLKAQDRKRNLAIQIGLTAIVVVFAVALVLYIVMSSDKVQPGEAKSIRVTSSKMRKETATRHGPAPRRTASPTNRSTRFVVSTPRCTPGNCSRPKAEASTPTTAG